MQVGHLFPRLLGQSEYNDRVKAVAPLIEAELLRLMDATPVPCGASAVTARRLGLYGYRRVPGWKSTPTPDVIHTPENPATLRVASVRSMPDWGRAYGLLDAERGMGQ
jgi:hypothetical protein